jgi:hypothetical protein
LQEKGYQTLKSQRGLSGENNIPSAISTAGTVAMVNMLRHLSLKNANNVIKVQTHD